MNTAYDSVLGLLRERGAEAIAHPGGTLLAHLQRVEERLRRHDADDVVRLSALAHAAYGTDGFDKHLLRLDERRLLEQVTNTEVERLVYLYGACDRKKSWASLAETGQVHDRWTGKKVDLDSGRAGRFVDLCIANELDVCEHSPEVKAKHGLALLNRFRTWQGLGSEAVMHDAEAVLGDTA